MVQKCLAPESTLDVGQDSHKEESSTPPPTVTIQSEDRLVESHGTRPRKPLRTFELVFHAIDVIDPNPRHFYARPVIEKLELEKWRRHSLFQSSTQVDGKTYQRYTLLTRFVLNKSGVEKKIWGVAMEEVQRQLVPKIDYIVVNGNKELLEDPMMCFSALIKKRVNVAWERHQEDTNETRHALQDLR